jgi:hypothetical protein
MMIKHNNDDGGGVLGKQEIANLIVVLKEWEALVGYHVFMPGKEMPEGTAGLDQDRYVALMRRLGETEIENNFSEDSD